MDTWAYVVAGDTPAEPLPVLVTTRRGPTVRLVLAVVAGVVALVVTLVVLLHRGTPPLSPLDRPSGMQRPLTTPLVGHDPTGGASFEIQLPGPPEPGSIASHPDSDGLVSFAGVRLGGEKFGALLLVKAGRNFASDPRDSLEQETKAAGKAGVLTPFGPIRRTRVGTTPAYVREFVMLRGTHVREFRFRHNAHLYAAGIVFYPDDTVSLDTGLAALQTFHWMG